MAEFTRYFQPPFEWIIGEWTGGDLTAVSFELAGRMLYPGDEFRLRQFRFRVYAVRGMQLEFECVRVSGKFEEGILAMVYLARDFFLSPFNYYWPKQGA